VKKFLFVLAFTFMFAMSAFAFWPMSTFDGTYHVPFAYSVVSDSVTKGDTLLYAVTAGATNVGFYFIPTRVSSDSDSVFATIRVLADWKDQTKAGGWNTVYFRNATSVTSLLTYTSNTIYKVCTLSSDTMGFYAYPPNFVEIAIGEGAAKVDTFNYKLEYIQIIPGLNR
jgi:hypothetical protein